MATPTLIQYADTFGTSNIAFPQPVTEGNLLLALGAVPGQVSDTLGNTYAGFLSDAENSFFVSICPASKSSGANTVHAGSSSEYWAIAEISASVIQAQSGISTGGTSSAIAGAAGELLIGLCMAEIDTITGVGGGFTQAVGNHTNHVSLEYQQLSSSGDVSSDFSVSGTLSRIDTSALTLSTPPTPLAGTPSVVQAVDSGGIFSNSVTKGNSILVVASQAINSGGTLTVADTLGNSYLPVVSNNSNFGSFFNGVSVFFCAASKSSGANTITVSGGLGAGTSNYAFELTPCIIAGSSAVATGTMNEPEISSAEISASAGQLLVAFANCLQTATVLGLPCSGFAVPSPIVGFVGNSSPGEFAQVATQPVLENGSFASGFTAWGAVGGPYQTGILALVSVYSISGNAGIGGATVSYSGAAQGSVTADGSGNFVIPNLLNGTYTITPSLGVYIFRPKNQVVTISNSSVSGVNFTATLGTPATVIGFTANWYYGQHNKGLSVYISPGQLNGVITQGKVVNLLCNGTTYVWVTVDGVISYGAEMPDGVYPVASVLTGIIMTGTGPNGFSPQVTQAPGVLNITDLRPINVNPFIFG